MFTGIVQGYCSVVDVAAARNLRRLRVHMPDLMQNLQVGASVAINGTCLTASAVNAEDVEFDVIRETLDNTNLSMLGPGAMVNVERSMQFGDEVGGHILSGHITARISVCAVHEADNERLLHFAVPTAWMKYLHHKGFIALDGASLTVAGVDTAVNQVTVALIPETIARTSLGVVHTGDWVNLEIDKQTQAIVDTVERTMASQE